MEKQKPEYLASVSLIVLGDDLDPDEVSEQLALQPDKTWRRGEQHRWGGWKKLAAEGKDAELPEQIEHWLGLLRPRADALDALTASGLHVALDCFVTPEGEDGGTASILLAPALLEEVGSLGVELRLSFQS